jgi:acyl carrier protein
LEEFMMRCDADSYAGSIRLRTGAVEAPAALVRPLGAFERLYHLRQQKNTMHFCMVAELADDLDPYALDAALLAVQQRHPLLNVYVKDDPLAGLGFYRPATVPAIPVTVIDAGTDRTWRDVVARELTRPFDTSIAPMIRVALLRRSGPSSPAAMVLTVDHAIVDGVSAGHILRDLFSALNGHDLAALPVPPSQETLIGPLRDAQPAAALTANGQMPPEDGPLSRPKVVLMTLPTDKAATAAALTREIVDFIRAEVGANDLTADSTLQSTGLDSVKVMSLVFKLESRYQISLDAGDGDDVRTVGDLANLVVRRLQERA